MIVLLTPEQVAAQLGVEVDTLKAWRYRNVGPAFLKLNRLVRYEPSAVDAYIESLRPKTNVTPIPRRRAG